MDPFSFLDTMEQSDIQQQQLMEEKREQMLKIREQMLLEKKRENKIKAELEEQKKQEELKKKIENEATIKYNEYDIQFNQKYKDTETVLKNINMLELNKDNIKKYYDVLLIKGNNMNSEIKTLDSDIITNNRKTYYEKQKYTTLYYWYNILYRLYIFLIILFSILIFIIPSQVNKKILGFILFGFILYIYLYPILIR